MSQKSIFKGVATILLLPGGFIALAVLAAAAALLLGICVYLAIFASGILWIVSRVRAWALSFRKALLRPRDAAPSVAAPSRGLPEGDSDYNASLPDWPTERTTRLRDASNEKWLQ